MRTLPENFTKNGFSHRIEWREGNIAIYRRWKEGQESQHWETIIIREQEAAEYQIGNGQILAIEHAELYPTAEQFGTYGWVYPTYEHARAKAEKLREP
jgi:hypothetical protein